MDTITNFLTVEMFNEGSRLYWSVYFLCMFLIIAVSVANSINEGKLTLSTVLWTLITACIPAFNVFVVGMACFLFGCHLVNELFGETGNMIVLWEKKDD